MDSYYSQAAPGNDPLDTSKNPNAFRDATASYFEREDAQFEIRVQPCTDLESVPVEDASVEWPGGQSPYRPVARLRLPRQPAMSVARRDYMNQRMSFRPSHSLAAHRPLGSLMRARPRTYAALAATRQRMNGEQPPEPREVSQIPD